MTMQLTNTNPDFYATREDAGKGFTQYVYSTLEKLEAGQPDGQQAGWLKMAAGCDTTIHARKLTLTGAIKAHGHTVKLFCKTLEIRGEVSIDVSHPLTTEEISAHKQGTSPTAEPGRPGRSGKERLRDPLTDKKSFGEKGKTGGTIIIACQELLFTEYGGKPGRLTLMADGSDGYPGLNGEHGGSGGPAQDGEGHWTYKEVWRDNAPVQEPDKFIIDRPAQPGQAGGSGGNGGMGGDGGDGGSITLHVCSDIPRNRITASAHGGNAGERGQGGNGGYMSRGSWVLDKASRWKIGDQATPKDADALPCAAPGRNAAPANCGEDGLLIIESEMPVGALGHFYDELFLLRLVQKVSARFQFNSPMRFSTQDKPYLDDSEWKSIGQELGWLYQVLQDYADDKNGPAKEHPLTQARKQDLHHDVGALVQRHAYGLTYYNEPASFVRRVRIGKLVEHFRTYGDYYRRVEERYLDLVNNLEAKKTELISYNDAIAEQTGLVDALEQSLNDCALQLDTLKGQLQAEQARFVTLSEQVGNLLERMKSRLDGYFECAVLKEIPHAAEMLAFGHGSAGMMVTMGLAEGASMFMSGMEKIDIGGHMANRKDVIGKLVNIGKDLKKEVGGLMVRGGVVKPEPSLLMLADIESYRTELDTLAGKLTEPGAGALLDEFTACLQNKNDLIMQYNAHLNAGHQYQARLTQARATLDKLDRKDMAPSQYELDTVTHYAFMYQRQMEEAFRMLYWMVRKYFYVMLKPPFGDADSVARKTFETLWRGGGNELSQKNFDALMEKVKAIDTKLELNHDGVSHPFPSDRKKKGIVYVSITDRELLDRLINKGTLTIRTVPPDSPQKSLRDEPVEMKVNGLHREDGKIYNVMLNCVRPRVYGATTTNKNKTASFTVVQEGDSAFKDKNDKLWSFLHDPVPVPFTHSLDEEKLYSDNEIDGGYDAGGEVSDSFMDNIGVFATWTIKLKPSQERDDPNFGLDLKNIHEIRLYFRGAYFFEAS